MNPLIDEGLRFLLNAASWVARHDSEFSRYDFPEEARPPSTWTKALIKADAQATAWLESDNLDVRFIARTAENIAKIENGQRSWPDMPAELHYQVIGHHVADALLAGNTDMLKALWDLARRWSGETREKNPKPIQLAVIQEAFSLWRKHKRNPTRNEVWAACEAQGIKVGGATNKRGLLQKTGLQFLA